MFLIAEQYPSQIAVAATKEGSRKIAEINFNPLNTAIDHILRDGITFENDTDRVNQDEAQQGSSSINVMSMNPSSTVSNVMKRKRYVQIEPTNEQKIHPAILETTEVDSELVSTLEVPAGLFSGFLL
ncbi:hypothetical protein G6F46_004824 [Rhizopus delemar]|uniref:Uncharacterized protein n=2 Tax=Rhizopus TaxID=4842 RepID=A0A9P6Z774_9FUNG|nr:hypothetical protein G6F55_002916 [Rhizopus delemar]KAG1546293.1 hypothetical protein G6F51_004962 [Rhizopus arrhizus]KAG1499801.1 hypothetical protein G6F54_004158 [Rhizopus delemar]KAG1513571.1 hypothetical protein G6F53_004337 [Rhizopus delemar]KAG1520773.1 hypothetical protein G6F52_007356 [Rhizopus delemar]